MEKIFYSWQSDLPNSTNRGFIQKALEAAAKSLRNDDSVNIEPVVDRDTAGIAGSPDITATIFNKIDAAATFVCDVSIINKVEGEPGNASRLTPNPNVLIELGYAAKSLGWDRIIMVMNLAFSKPENLPFDLRPKRVVEYDLDEATADKAEERKKLEKILALRLREVFGQLDSFLPDLPKNENKLFKEICELALNKDYPNLYESDLLIFGNGVFSSEFTDSLEILETKGYVKLAWALGRKIKMLTVLPLGFELYAIRNLDDFSKLTSEIAKLISDKSVFDSKQLSEQLDRSHSLIVLICQMLERKKLLKLSSGNGMVRIAWNSPELKRY